MCMCVSGARVCTSPYSAIVPQQSVASEWPGGCLHEEAADFAFALGQARQEKWMPCAASNKPAIRSNAAPLPAPRCQSAPGSAWQRVSTSPVSLLCTPQPRSSTTISPHSPAKVRPSASHGAAETCGSTRGRGNACWMRAMLVAASCTAPC